MSDWLIFFTHWKRLFTVTVWAAYLYAIMEWLFFFTMPSFMDAMSLASKLAILAQIGLILAILCVLLLLVGMVIDMILTFLKLPSRAVFVGVLLPAILLACLSLLLLDNFTYTLFKFGVVSTAGVWRGVYALGSIFLLATIYFMMLSHLGLVKRLVKSWLVSSRLFYGAGFLLLISVMIALPVYQSPTSVASGAPSMDASEDLHRPNILLLGGDGISADHLSLYGYARNTTPRLLELARTSLVAQNAFPNATPSEGSLVSIFSSKLPTETRVMYMPDALTGSDVFEHLPGILRHQGYRTEQLAVDIYIDALVVNLQDGFDRVNGHDVEDNVITSFFVRRGYDHAAYFLQQMSDRIFDRLQHIFYFRQMEIIFGGDDQAKVARLIDLLTQSRQPLFVHAHLMGTHGGLFAPRQSIFSQGQEQSQEWMTNFYDDAIYDFDRYVGEIIDALQQAGALDNTIIIIYSDHGIHHSANRIPLLIHFPQDEYSGEIQFNVQNLDLAPTILDYLGLEIPRWMDGQSLLGNNLPPNRLIFTLSGRGFPRKNLIGELITVFDRDRFGPPFFQFSAVTISQCHKWYRLSFMTLEWSSGVYSDHTAPCAEGSLYSFEQIQQALADHLSSNGFDISTLP